MKSRRPIRLLEMKVYCLLLGLALLALISSGCSTNNADSNNASVRPWNAPQSWENGMGGMDNYQHP